MRVCVCSDADHTCRACHSVVASVAVSVVEMMWWKGGWPVCSWWWSLLCEEMERQRGQMTCAMERTQTK